GKYLEVHAFNSTCCIEQADVKETEGSLHPLPTGYTLSLPDQGSISKRREHRPVGWCSCCDPIERGSYRVDRKGELFGAEHGLFLNICREGFQSGLHQVIAQVILFLLRRGGVAHGVGDGDRRYDLVGSYGK